MEVSNKTIGVSLILVILFISSCKSSGLKIHPLQPIRSEDAVGNVVVNTYYYLVNIGDQKKEIVFKSLRTFTLAERSKSPNNLVETFIFYKQSGSLDRNFKESSDVKIDDFQENIIYSFTLENNVLSWIEYENGKPINTKTEVSGIDNSR